MSANQNPFAQTLASMQEFQQSFFQNFSEKGQFSAPSADQFSGQSQQLFQNARKNYQAFSNLSKAIMDSAQIVSSNNAEYFRQVADATADYCEQAANVKSPQEGFEKQAKFAKEFSEHAMSNSKEVSDIVSKSGGEVTEIVNARFSEALGEMSDLTGSVVRAAESAANTATAGNSNSKKKAA